MSRRWPWGYGRAPALYCDECGRRIGRERLHFILDSIDSTRLMCGRCIDRRELHAKYYPACPDGDWHDMYDHPLKLATRAAAWFILSDAESRRSA